MSPFTVLIFSCHWDHGNDPVELNDSDSPYGPFHWFMTWDETMGLGRGHVLDFQSVSQFISIHVE